MGTSPKTLSWPARGRALAALLACALLGLVDAGAAPGAPGVPSRAFDDAEECTEAVPAAASVAGVIDDGREIVLDVHLLLDGVSQDRGEAVVRKAQEAFRPLRITLRPTFQEVSFPAQRMAVESITGQGAPVPTSDSSYLFQRSKEAVGGTRPADADVVYLLTSDHITGSVAGVADCIGGVRYPNRAFAIGEEEPDGPPHTLALCCTWATAKIAAHEIAHLLGAHHHYANCVEGTPAAVADRHLGTCTMMFNDVGLVNLQFSTLEAAIVRGHALKFADRPPSEGSPPEATPAPTASPTPAPSASPAPTPPPSASPTPAPPPTSEPTPEPTPTPAPPPTASPEPTPSPEPEPATVLRGVAVELSKHLVVRGRVDAGSVTSCSGSVRLIVERRKLGEWRLVGEATTASDGSFRIRLPDRNGRYRAVAPEVTVDDGSETYECSIAASTPQRHRHRR